MNKIIIFMRGVAPDRILNQAALHDAVDRFADNNPTSIAGVHVNHVNTPPKNLPYRPPSDPNAGKEPEYDIIVELWTEETSQIASDRLKAHLSMVTGSFHAYAVRPSRIYDRRTFLRGTPSAGIKLIGRLMFHADMSDSAVRRSWSLHAALAAKVHVGSAIYIQNWVDSALCIDCPPTRGMPIMHFPSDEDFYQRFVDSPRGMEEIIQDTSHFVAGGPRFYTTEHILRANSANMP